MQRASEILRPMLKRLTATGDDLAKISGTWNLIVGKSLSAHTRPVRLAGGELEIRADSREWRESLEALAGRVPAQINSFCPRRVVERIRVTSPPDSKDEKLPFLRKRGVTQDRGREKS
ncbi:MAG: DUF721 domain-containing protein [Candidatus Acidiferrales bacterium]